MAPGSSVTTAPRSLARLTFKNQARCTLGGLALSRIFVRAEESSLFTQEQGYSSCTSLHGGQPINVLCKPDEPCGAEVRARGTYLVKIPPPAATISATEIVRRVARVVVCSGFVRVRIERDGSYSESTGRSSGINRYVLLIEETFRNTDHDNLNEREITLDTSVVGNQPGPGDCADPAVEEQQETVERY